MCQIVLVRRAEQFGNLLEGLDDGSCLDVYGWMADEHYVLLQIHCTGTAIHCIQAD